MARNGKAIVHPSTSSRQLARWGRARFPGRATEFILERQMALSPGKQDVATELLRGFPYSVSDSRAWVGNRGNRVGSIFRCCCGDFCFYDSGLPVHGLFGTLARGLYACSARRRLEGWAGTAAPLSRSGDRIYRQYLSNRFKQGV